MKIGRRNMVVGIVCLILILYLVASASASEVTKPHEPAQEVGQESHGVSPGGEIQETGQKEAAEGAHEVTGEEKKAEGHETPPEGEEAGEGHEGGPGVGHGPPFVYWFTWVFLLLTMITLVQYLLNTGKEAHEGVHGKESKYHSIGYAVTIGIFVVIVVTISLLPSVGQYHESSAVGFVRFLLMIITGFLLMAYGFREHELHKLHAHH